MTPDPILLAAANARVSGMLCALATVVEAIGSCPREAGAKMLVHGDGRGEGTIGGGKFEALVVEDALAALRERRPRLRTYPLHEGDAASFGAICGGSVTVFIEPVGARERLFVIGAGHVGAAVAHLARQCGLFVELRDDREMPGTAPAEFVGSQQWTGHDALVIVNRNPALDRAALSAVLRLVVRPGYIGMIGSGRKVRRVFDEMQADGFTAQELAGVFAPIGIDIGSDTPAEIAVSVLAEVLQVLRGRPGGHLRGSGAGS